MREKLQQALRLADVDYCEIRFEKSHLLNIVFQSKGLDRIGKEIQYGGCVRALHKGGWGFASFNDLADLKSMVKEACQQAKVAGEKQGGKSILAPVPVVEDKFVPSYTLDPRSIELDEKVRILTRYNDLILGADPAITYASINYGEKISELFFANTEGTYIEQEKLDLAGGLGATARRGSTTVSQGVGRGSSLGFDCMLNVEADLLEACENVVKLLDAPQVKAGVYPVICDPSLADLFVHEAFGHLSEADDIHKNPDLAKTMTLGRRLGRDTLTIYDTGEYFKSRGALKYDDEGVEATRIDLIKNGILTGRLHTRQSAGMMGEAPTGSARALNYNHPPISRMRATCIENGEHSFSDMIKDIELGVYAVGGVGGQTNGEMFNFMAGRGYMIRNGEIAELVKDVKLMGNVFTTLENIDMIGNDAKASDGPGGCGKGDQSPLPVSGTCPHIRIQNVIMGGEK